MCSSNQSFANSLGEQDLLNSPMVRERFEKSDSAFAAAVEMCQQPLLKQARLRLNC
jgi:hypothetical protein